MFGTILSPLFLGADISMDQESALSLILSALYILPIFHIFKKRTSGILSPISVSTLFFVNFTLHQQSIVHYQEYEDVRKFYQRFITHS